MKRLVGAPMPWALVSAFAALGAAAICASWSLVDEGDPLSASDRGDLALEGPTRPRPGRCPEGFPKRMLRDGNGVCSVGESQQAVCPIGQACFPGDASCAPLGRACDAGPSEGVTTRVGSTGAASFATLAEAL